MKPFKKFLCLRPGPRTFNTKSPGPLETKMYQGGVPDYTSVRTADEGI